VESAGAISTLPVSGGFGAAISFSMEGRPDPEPGEPGWAAGTVLVMPGYFETMGIPLVAGRSFDARDQHDAPWAAVVNEEAVRLYWPGENPLGRRLRYATGPDFPDELVTIVGVVKNTRADGAQAEPRPQIFIPRAQMPRGFGGRTMTIVARASGDPLAIAAAVNATVRAADPALPLLGGRPMEDIVNQSVGQPRFTSQLATFFAAVALVLGALGIHGLLSYVVAQRRGELGVRLALGARPAALLKLVVGQGMWLAGLGVALGVVAAFAGARVLRTLLFGVTPNDPASFAIAIAVLGAAAFGACYGPARRAARIDPITALRAE
jgi:putative ABC transport system permease protein